MSFPYRFSLFFLILFLSVPGGISAGPRAENSQGETLSGKWYSSEGTAQFNNDGTMLYNGQSYYYSAANGIITLLGADGMSAVPYELSDGKLTATIDGNRTIFTRRPQTQGENRRPVVQSSNLAGKWCYMSNISATSGGGRMSNRCFTLYENGTYGYYSETSSSGQYGSAASQESDRGTWSATETSLTVNSAKNGTRVYRLQKRNHPKTGDAMLVVDGDAFVTYYNRRPW